MQISLSIAKARRNTELGLVLLAGAITSAAYVLASLGKNASIPARIGPFMAFVVVLLVLAHIVVRLIARGADPLLLPVAALLHGIGFVMIVSRFFAKSIVKQLDESGVPSWVIGEIVEGETGVDLI